MRTEDNRNNHFYNVHIFFHQNYCYTRIVQIQNHKHYLPNPIHYNHMHYIRDNHNILRHMFYNNHHQNLVYMDIGHCLLHNNNRRFHLNYIHMPDNLDSQNDRTNRHHNRVLEILDDIHICQFLQHNFQLSRNCHNHNLKINWCYIFWLFLINPRILLTPTNICFIPTVSTGTIVFWFTFITIDTFRIV